ncbi:MAG: precorrin-4 C(11)-methyltransferase [Actinomycetota bacterium]|nr:precorrin-4 C(11)-methyltransferase [Actinomycetota bacterium]
MISFVGAGPGSPDLITLRGKERLEAAEIVIWASSLVPEALLAFAPQSALRYDSASMTLEDVLAVYAANPGARVVRLHSGDPSVYGAIQEQIDYCVANALAFEIVPGVTSVAAAAAIVGRELTIPGVAQSVVFTRMAGKTSASMPDRESVAAYARIGGTMGIFLSAAHPNQLQQALLGADSAFNAKTPAVVIIRATWPDEEIHWTAVGNLASTIKETGAKRTLLVLVGDALTEVAQRSHLYSPSYAHIFRHRSSAGTTTGRPTPAARRRDDLIR